ncbi:MAG: DUF1353 domain-containing protein [Actinomycetota bacterium]
MSADEATDVSWTAWRVAPTSGFVVDNADGEVGLVQIDAAQFSVSHRFQFVDDTVREDIVTKLTRTGIDRADAEERFGRAAAYGEVGGTTDLASIPPFMRWFENTYGVHTLAAILHDELIVETVNGGHLGSDTLADRFFRLLLDASGVPRLKSWLMWAAVALRTRWAAGGHRRLSVVIWVLAALAGIVAAVVGICLAIWSDNTGWATALIVVAIVGPFASALLWGQQWGASFIAAVAAVFVVPASVFAILGRITYGAMERTFRAVRS